MSTPSEPSIPGLSLSSACRIHRPTTATTIKKMALAEWQARSKKMATVVMKTHDRIFDVQEHGNGQFLEQLMRFITDKARDSMGYIPTAMVKLGINIADNKTVFDLIETRLNHTGNFKVIKLNHADLSSMSTILIKLCHTILTKEILDEIFTDKKPKRSFFQSMTYWSLMKLRQEVENEPLPIVIMIPELDSVDAQTGLRQLIPVVKSHLDAVPVTLVCGTYTNAITIHHLLPARITSCLYVETFVVKEPKVIFEAVIEKVLLSPDFHGFKLGPKLISIIIENFIFNDYSLQTVISLIKIAIFNHLYTSHLALKFTFKNDYRINGEFSELSATEIQELVEEMKQLPSMEKLSIPNESSAFKTFMKTHILSTRKAYTEFITTLRYLWTFSHSLPEAPFGNSFSELFKIATDPNVNITKTPEFQTALIAFKFLPLREIKSRIEECLNNIDSDGTAFKELLDTHLEKIVELEREADKAIAQPPVESKIDFSDCRSRHDWKEKLKNSISQRPLSSFESWRLQFVNDLGNVLGSLQSPYTMPLSEVMFYDNSAFMQSRSSPSPRSEIITQLKKPYMSLSLNASAKHNTGSEPLDITLIYNQLLLGGPIINLHDLLESFKCQREPIAPGPSATGKRKKTKQPASLSEQDRARLLRFFSAIEDLEYSGFVLKNKRKCDHLTKLVWE